MKKIWASLILIVGIVTACYFGGWIMLLKPIIDCCKAFDSGMLTGLMIGISILKCIFASAVAYMIFFIFSRLSLLCLK